MEQTQHELSAEDQQRIESKTHELYHEWRENDEFKAFRNGAEYATIFERAKQAELQSMVSDAIEVLRINKCNNMANDLEERLNSLKTKEHDNKE